MKLLLGAFVLGSTLFGQNFVPPETIEAETSKALSDIKKAQKLFNPWYTGPIIAASASMMPPGMINIQPYLFAADNYAAFNKDRHSVNQPNLWQINPQLPIQTGITSWLDCAVSPQMFSNNKHSHWYTGFGDLYCNIGIKLCDEGVRRFKMKISINETFPTGKYQNLNPKNAGTDAIGGGSFVTGFSFRASKVFFWWMTHPLAVRTVLIYNIPTTVHVKGYNTYGGGHGTKGKVRPGNSFTADLGLELSLNQKWVLATDIVYQLNNITKFHGTKGIDPATGKPNEVGAPSSDSLSLAPALEYNYNENLGFIGGVWFTVWGRNTANFINYVLSVTYVFSVK